MSLLSIYPPKLSLQDSSSGEIDLHGLYVKEALERTDRAIQEAKERGDSELRLIVGQYQLALRNTRVSQVILVIGKGLHSKGSARIRPAVEELMQKSVPCITQKLVPGHNEITQASSTC